MAVFLADLSAHLLEWLLHLGTAERHQSQRILTCSVSAEPSFNVKAAANGACLVPNLFLTLFT